MIDFERVPLWVMAVVMLVLTVLAVGGLSSLMRTRALRLWVLVVVPVGCLFFIVLEAVLKRNSLYHAMLLYDDAMIMLACIVLAALPEDRRLRREAARTGTAPAELSAKAGTRAVWIATPVLVVVIVAEYLLASHHQL